MGPCGSMILTLPSHHVAKLWNYLWYQTYSLGFGAIDVTMVNFLDIAVCCLVQHCKMLGEIINEDYIYIQGRKLGPEIFFFFWVVKLGP